MEGKKWYHSKVLWFNATAAIAALLQAKYGLVIDGPTQGLILTGVNLLLRAITKEQIEW